MKSVVAPFIPYRLKRFIKAVYAKDKNSLGLDTYEARMVAEKEHYLEQYQDRSEDEPLFERAPDSWGYVERAAENFIRAETGYGQWDYIINAANQLEAPEMLSIGSGPCGVEMALAERITSNYHYHCIDLNEQVLEIGKRQIDNKGLNMTVEPMDLNFINLESKKYDIITAFASLHHLIELEKIYAAINDALKPNGIFVTVDVITRNGLMMWPETFDMVNKIWDMWPDKYKFSHTYYASPRFVPKFKNIDYGAGSFEAARSQDLLPLIPAHFDPIVYVPYHTICRRFLDTQFGLNYDFNDPFDYGLVEFIWNLDQYYLRERILPPETMFAVMRKKGTADPKIAAKTSARMKADSRARMKKWVVPSHLNSLSYWLKTLQEELLNNAQFEILENKLPMSWVAYGTPLIDTSGTKSSTGKVAVRVDKDNGLYQQLAVTPNKRYLLQHVSKADKKGQSVRLQVNWHDADENFMRTNIDIIEAETDWKQNEMLVTAPLKATYAHIYISVHENSRIWFDTVSFVEVKEKESVDIHGSLVA